MNTIILPGDVVNVVRSFLSINDGDESTERLILSIGCELLDISEDEIIEMLDDKN